METVDLIQLLRRVADRIEAGEMEPEPGYYVNESPDSWYMGESGFETVTLDGTFRTKSRDDGGGGRK